MDGSVTARCILDSSVFISRDQSGLVTLEPGMHGSHVSLVARSSLNDDAVHSVDTALRQRTIRKRIIYRAADQSGLTPMADGFHHQGKMISVSAESEPKT